MTPAEIRAWQGIFRDAVIICVAAFMLLYDTVVASSANPYIIGAGLTLLGLPPAFRLDSRRRQRDDDDEDDPYDGPGGYYRDG